MGAKTPATGNMTRNVGPLTLRAAFEPSSLDREKRTVDVTWTTGAQVLRSTWMDGTFLEELSLDPKHVRMGRLNNGAPFMADHGRSTAQQAGVVVEGSALLTKKEGRATVRFIKAGVDPEADKLFEKIADGIVRNISVGYRTFKAEKVETGDKTTPVFRAVDWEPYELSAVAMGADDGAGVRNASSETNPCVFVTPSEESRSMEENEQEKAARLEREAKATADAQRAAGDQTKRDAEIEQRASQVERERAVGIADAVRVAKLPQALITTLLASTKDLAACRAAVLDELAKRSEQVTTENHVRAEITDDNQDKFVRGVSAAMFERAGTSQLIEQAKAKGGKIFANDTTDAGEFRGMGFADIARACLARRGIRTDNMYNKEALFAQAFSLRSGGFAGTSDFAVLLENVMFKQLRAAYETQANTWERWCGTDEVQDYRTSNRFDLGSFGTLDTKGENGEYKNKAIPDGAKKTLVTEDRGNIIGVSREMLINDDMGSMANLSTAFGKTAARSIEVAAYDLLNLHSGLGPYMTGTTPFFDDTAYSNVSTGAALSATALDQDKQKMRLQLDISGNDYLDQVPRILLVNPALEAAAKILNTDAFDPAQVGQKSNIARGMFDDIVTSPRLGSGTKRYLFAPSKEAFKVVFLAGESRGPVMATQNGWRTDGIEWKCRCTFKVQGFDPKAAVYNAGA